MKGARKSTNKDSIQIQPTAAQDDRFPLIQII